MDFFNFRIGLLDRLRILKNVNEVLHNGVFIGGKYVAEFEEIFSEYVGAEAAVGCGNGLDAIKLAIRALDLEHGSRIAVSAHTFFATWLAVIAEGCIPVGVDASIENGQMSPTELETLLSSDSSIAAVLYVHMHGIAGEVRKIADMCEKYGVALIEDCAQAHGLTIDGKHAGAFGEMGAFSFYPTKNLPAFGDAGCVVSTRTYEKSIRTISNYGWEPGNRDKHLVIGTNSRLDTIQAVFLSLNIQKLDSNNARRNEIAKIYMQAIPPSSSLKVLGRDSESVWHHFPVLVENRDEFLHFMKQRGVSCQIHYKTPCHRQPAVTNIPLSYARREFPVTEQISAQIVSLPMHPWLSDKEVRRVSKTLREWSRISA